MKLINRNSCFMCNNTKFSYVKNFESFPVYMGTTTYPAAEDKRADMSFVECVRCGTVQLDKLIPLDILYKDSHAGVVGKTWAQHHSAFCDFISKYVFGNVVEIGGSNLMVANMLADMSDVKRITVFDNQIYYENLKSSKIVPREEFFDANNVPSDTDCIIHTHLIEHLYDPIMEFKKINNALDEGDYMMFAAPLIDNMLIDGFTNAMNFEHTYLLTDKKVSCMMHASNFAIIDKFNFSPYAAFYVCKKDSSRKEDLILNSHLADGTIIRSFISHHEEEIKRITSLLNEESENTFIFGAHIFTQFLFGFGLKEESFCNILDNDPKKINNRLYGTNLIVKSPKVLSQYENPLVLLKAAQYTDEIKDDILANINPNTRFIL